MSWRRRIGEKRNRVQRGNLVVFFFFRKGKKSIEKERKRKETNEKKKTKKKRIWILTSDDHHTGGEDFFVVGFCGDVAETDGRHASHCEIEGRDVHRLPGRPVDQLGRVAVVGPDVGVRRLGHVGQLPQPAVLDAVVGVRPADRVPDAGQPVGHQHVEAEKQDQHGGSVFQVAVQLADHPAQSQQADHL